MFSLNFKKKTKIDNYVGIWGHSWYYWKAFTKFDLIMLQKCDLYFEILVGIVVRNSKKLQKEVRKENSIECIQTWANDIGYISV
jgi:hypothetical protein